MSPLIDGSDFHLIAGYLISERSPIDFMLHLRNREDLVMVAEALDRAQFTEYGKVGSMAKVVHQMMREGNLKVSSRFPMELPDPAWKIDPSMVQQEVFCYVLYRPPYYLVHTPGLFEGTVMEPERPQRAQSRDLPSKSPTQRQSRHQKDHGHSH